MGTSRSDATPRTLAVLLVEAGWGVTAVCRAFGVTRTTFYQWKSDHPARSPEVAGPLAALKAGERTGKWPRGVLAADLAPHSMKDIDGPKARETCSVLDSVDDVAHLDDVDPQEPTSL